MKVQGYVAGARTAIASTKEFHGELDKLRAKNSAAMHDIQFGAAAAGAAMLALAGWAVKSALAFDKQMSDVHAITNASVEDMGRLREAALKAGKDTAFSATEAAKAESELAKAGLTTSDILGGALTGALSLAAAGDLDLADAAAIAAKTMGQFGLKGSDVSHIADLLAGAANATATDVHELGEALKMGGLAASSAGMSVEDTTTVLGAFAQQALTGSDAGTSLKTMLMMLQSPTEKAQTAMAKYGFSVYDANGNMVDAYSIAGRLKQSFGGLTQEQRNAAFATIFGADAMRAANVLYKAGEQGLHGVNKELLAQADAARVAAQKQDNLSGDIEKLKGSLDTLFIDSAQGANSGLRIVVQALDQLIGHFTALPGPVQSAIVILAGLSGTGLLAAAGFMKIRGAVVDALEALREAGPVSARAATALERAGRYAGQAAIAFGALAAAGGILDAAFHKDIDPQIEALANSIAHFGETGQVGGEGARIFGDNLGDLDRALASTKDDLLTNFDEVSTSILFMSNVYGENADRIQAIDQALTMLVQNGHADEAAAAFKRLWEEAQKQGVSLEELQAAFPGYIAAANKGTGAIKDLGLGFNKAAEEVETFTDAWKRMHGAVMDADEAMLAAKQAIDDVGDSFDKNGNKVKGNSEAALENRIALEKAAKAADEAAQAYLDNGGNAAGAAKIMHDFQVSAEKATGATGKAKDEVHKLADELFKVQPKTITVKVNLSVNRAQLNHIKAELQSGKYEAHGGVMQFYASGGENHVAQMAPAGAMRVWAEPETGGEAYIPLAAQKRARSMAVLANVAQRFNVPLGGYAGGGDRTITVIVKDTSGRTLRNELINDGLGRGLAESTIRAAYP